MPILPFRKVYGAYLSGKPPGGVANLLIAPSLDAANISFNMIKTLGDGLPLGPILLGLGHTGHIVTPSVTVRAS